jgi:hypothetical protein
VNRGKNDSYGIREKRFLSEKVESGLVFVG